MSQGVASKSEYQVGDEIDLDPKLLRVMAENFFLQLGYTVVISDNDLSLMCGKIKIMGYHEKDLRHFR